MRYLSVCSGIEAASVAWGRLGWEPLAFAEIEPFPRAVLAHHYPDVPLHGDFTKLRDQAWIMQADVLVGGTPCQAFSVAGLRNSLSDERGNLSLEFVRLADAIDTLRSAAGTAPAVIVWENVPGVLSVRDNAFGCFLSGLAGDAAPYDPPRGKWTNAGVVDGPARTVAWRILDAQYFGLAQRRRRVFVVASARAGFDPAAVLLEFEGMRRDTPPRREAGKGTAHATAPCLTSSGRGVERTGDTRGQDPVVAVSIASTGDISHCLNAGGMGRQDYEPETLVTHSLRAEGFDASEDGTGRGTPLVPVQAFYSTESRCDNFPPPDVSPPLKVGSNGGGQPPAIAFSAKDHGGDATEELAPTLRAMPHDASHANGGGQMAVAVPLQEVGKRTGIGIGQDGDPMFTLQAGAQHGVAYPLDLRNAGRDPDKRDEQNRQGLGLGEDGDPSPTISTAFVPGVAAYAFQPRIARNGRGDMGDVVNALAAQSGETGKGDAAPCVATFQQSSMKGKGTIGYDDSGIAKPVKTQMDGQMVHAHMAVRRLTATECERLQGFPDGYTNIPWRGKPEAPDGPRYKALGNSMAVPVMRWIGRRIAAHLSASKIPTASEYAA